MKGYYNNPAATDDIFRPDGWMRTGDIAHYDENHAFYITDRLKELIKVFDLVNYTKLPIFLTFLYTFIFSYPIPSNAEHCVNTTRKR